MFNIIEFLQSDSMRYERKYKISVSNENQFFFHLNKHPFLFYPSYPERFVNNIYLDTPVMSNYWNNVTGLSQRLKVRIRWYGEALGIQDAPILEFKIKNNAVGHKVCYKLPPLLIGPSLTIKDIQQHFDELDIAIPVKSYLMSLRLSLMNRYRRKYYISQDQRFRLTFDSDMSFTSIYNYENTFIHKVSCSKCRVLEMKYDECFDSEATHISNNFPFRMTKSSKYVYGIDKLKMH